MAKNPTFTTFAGIKNTAPPERLHVMPDRQDGTTDLVEAVNVDIGNSGDIARRSGTTLKRAGAAHSLWSVGDMCLFVAGQTMYRLDPDYSSEAMAVGLTANAPVSYVEVNGRIYWGNGYENGVISGGRARSWGMDIPASPGLSAVAGQLTPGQYQCVVTHVRNDSQESGAALPSVITLAADGGIRVTWALPSDATIELARVYLSPPDGTVMYLAAECPIDDLYTEVASGRNAVPLATQWQDKPPAGQALAYSRGRIYIAVGEFLFATTALGFEYVDLRDYFALDGTRIRFAIGVEHGIYVGTTQACYFLSGDTFEEMTVTVVSAKEGVAGSAIHIDGMRAVDNPKLDGIQCAMFTSGDGVYLGLPDGTVMNLTYDRYGFDVAATGAAVFHENEQLNHYVLFLQR